MEIADPIPLRPSTFEDPPTVGTMWHVTLTLAGPPVPTDVIKAALERLSAEHPFLLAGRYSVDRAEVRYWEEARDVASALRMAVLLWDEHTVSAQLPPWQVVGVEVVDRETFHRRGRLAGDRSGGLVAAGRVLPF